MNLTKQEAIRLHREMWRRISELSDEEILALVDTSVDDNPVLVIKRKVIKDMGHTPSNIYKLCFLCNYAETCDNCPVIWGGRVLSMCTTTEYSIFIDCIKHGDYLNARNLAAQISELPERKNIVNLSKLIMD